MKITVIHGQSHKGMTYTITHKVLDYLICEQDEVKEYFLPKDGPDFCCGCNNCFLKGEHTCPSSKKMKSIVDDIDTSDILIIDSPNYVLEMSGSLKNFFDHLAYRWVTHRPRSNMYTKIGVAICSSAGAPCGHTTRSIAKQLKWQGMSTIYQLPFICNALSKDDLSSNKLVSLDKKAQNIARKIKKEIQAHHISIRSKLFFMIFRNMQLSANAGWNSTDRDWWINQGWTKQVRPWKKESIKELS